VLGSPLIIFGLLLYGISAIIWLLVLSRVDLSLAYPMLAIGYIFVLLVSLFFLGEKVTLMRWLGTVLIVGGVVLNASTARG
jgi:drug/metabolite transporter (DMT)-like permease